MYDESYNSSLSRDYLYGVEKVFTELSGNHLIVVQWIRIDLSELDDSKPINLLREHIDLGAEVVYNYLKK